MRVPKNWQEIPGSNGEAFKVGGKVVRVQHGGYQLREDNGNGWGNGDIIGWCPTQKHVNARVAELAS